MKHKLAILITIPLVTVLATACVSPATPVEVLPSSLPAATEVIPTVPGNETETPPAQATSTAELLPDTPTALPQTAVLPDPAGTGWKQIAGGFARPVDAVHAGDDSGRLFILEQAGVIRVLQNDIILPDPFLDIHDRVGSGGNEQGLLGIAFHPAFPDNGYFFLNYTDPSGNTRISRFTAPPGPGDIRALADPGSEKLLLAVNQPYANHNGGQLAFGPDGYLYIGLGDGGGQGDPNGNGQSNDSFLGKILRIDVDSGDPYAIPADNPFAAGDGLAEIWATGLRNPWRFSFDRLTGDLFIADVGQKQWEEIDFLPSGSPSAPANFGWNIREGSHLYREASTTATLIDPIHEYGHDQGCSVTGGMVYRGSALPTFQGVYLFGDYCAGTIWGLIPSDDGSWESKVLFQTKYKIASFGVDQSGEVYLLDLNGGLYRLEAE